MNWDTVKSRFQGIMTRDGYSVTHTPRSGSPVTSAFNALLNRSGEEGEALCHIPIASVASPVFADLITVVSDSSQWRISEVRQDDNGATPCNLMKIDYWAQVDIEFLNDAFDPPQWDTHTTGVWMILEPVSSDEAIDLDNLISTTTYECTAQYMASVNDRMRIKNGSQYLYIQGIEPDKSNSKTMLITAAEKEA